MNNPFTVPPLNKLNHAPDNLASPVMVVLQPEVVLVSSVQPLADDEAERVVVVANVAEAAHLQHGLLWRRAGQAIAVVGRRVGQLLPVNVGHGGGEETGGLSVELQVRKRLHS